MRINLDHAARTAGHAMPDSVKSMINDIVRDFCREYQIGDVEAYGYLLTRENIHRMVDLMRSKNIDVEPYDMAGLSSWD
jgi:hypothetical protein